MNFSKSVSRDLHTPCFVLRSPQARSPSGGFASKVTSRHNEASMSTFGFFPPVPSFFTGARTAERLCARGAANGAARRAVRSGELSDAEPAQAAGWRAAQPVFGCLNEFTPISASVAGEAPDGAVRLRAQRTKG